MGGLCPLRLHLLAEPLVSASLALWPGMALLPAATARKVFHQAERPVLERGGCAGPLTLG